MFGFAASGSPATHHKKQAQLVSRLIVVALIVLVILLAGLRSDWKLFGDDALKNGHSASTSFSLNMKPNLVEMEYQMEKNTKIK